MKFDGNVAVVTGAGDGMGRELTKALVSHGCSVAICDINVENMNLTREEAMAIAVNGATVSTFKCDVSNEEQVQRFAEYVGNGYDLVGKGFLLFNNAGIGGGGSIVSDPRESWERTFNINWYGVYYSVRAFMPLLLNAKSGYVVNTSSVNGFWASIGFMQPHTAYSASKFAVKGFTEALINDFRLHAPHLKAAVVMPGHIGTGIAQNSMKAGGNIDIETIRSRAKLISMRVAQLKASSDPQYLLLSKDVEMLARYENGGRIMEAMTDQQIFASMNARGADFRNNARTTAAEAARIILEGVAKDEWRILVGPDAVHLDGKIRSDPWRAYDANFVLPNVSLVKKGGKANKGRVLTRSKI